MDLIIVMVLFCSAFMQAKQNSGFGADSRARKIAKKELGIKKTTMIRYDMRDLYIMRNTMIVLGVLIVGGAVAALVLVNSPVMDEIYYAVGKEGFWVLVGSLYACLFTILIMTGGFFYEGWCYVNRLAMHRYYVPDNKKDYFYALEGLPREEEVEDESIIIPEKGANKESIKLTILNLITSAGIAIMTGIYHWKWGDLFEKAWLFYGSLTAMWLIGSLVYYRQSDERIYRDDVDIDVPGKPRISWGSGVSVYIYYLIFTICLMLIIWEITRYEYEWFMPELRRMY